MTATWSRKGPSRGTSSWLLSHLDSTRTTFSHLQTARATRTDDHVTQAKHGGESYLSFLFLLFFPIYPAHIKALDFSFHIFLILSFSIYPLQTPSPTNAHVKQGAAKGPHTEASSGQSLRNQRSCLRPTQRLVHRVHERLCSRSL